MASSTAIRQSLADVIGEVEKIYNESQNRDFTDTERQRIAELQDQRDRLNADLDTAIGAEASMLAKASSVFAERGINSLVQPKVKQSRYWVVSPQPAS
jgi:hypothetical protein